MTILTALATLYERMAGQGEAPRLGFSIERIGGEVVIDADGRVLKIASMLVPDEKGRNMLPRSLAVPAAVKRASGIAANRLWDKTAYTLGLIAEAGDDGGIRPGQGRRTAEEHAAFKTLHAELLAETDDPGLLALRRFLERWQPEDFAGTDQPIAVLNQNIVFRLDGDCDDMGRPRFVHDRPAAIELIQRPGATEGGMLCLVTGERAPVARLHPSIKGVAGGQSSGASLVAFNSEAYESHGKSQGDNAPVSERAAFAYGTALNALLAKGERRHLRIGDSTVVFWAEAPEASEAEEIEALMAESFDPPVEDEDSATAKLRARLEAVAQGSTSETPEFDPTTRVYILGLAPNAARVSVRFWYPGTVGDFARNVSRFWKDLEIAPAPWKTSPTAWSLLYETALQRKAENIPPLLGGELMRAVLTGSSYPRSLLSAVIGRIRADGEISGRRAAICKAFIRRNIGKEEIPVALDPDSVNPAYRLGRLFAVLERIQQAARPGLNANIKDRYFAAASATPARMFPVLVKNATHHLALLRKGEGGGLAHWMDAEMGRIWAGLGADLPRSLNLEDQGRFVAGYYHQRWAKKQTHEANAEEVSEDQGASG
ncbi:type I-C CRISPR-associated protein Cas8c/Csd1 [Aquibaculum sediminis]|uniref:type I-C CRISPR-associated protein Cas8c/Csd1 n=1 Tax=Aquibaculum sediminis TaxID=3231907 RepID=UPI00345706AB